MPDLLLELRSEEIPARMQRKAAGDLKKLITDGLVEAGLTYEGAKEYWTPRRLTLDVRGLTARSKDVREERKGPSTKAPEQAIQGFLRSAGLSSVEEAEIRSDPKKGDFYVAVISKPGRAAEEIIAELVPQVIRAFPWPKSMRWGPASARPGSLRWVRPLQSILCTFGPETEEPAVVDFEVDGIRSGNVTWGHRFHAPEAFPVRRFDDYVAKLEKARVILDADRRKQIILDDAKNLAFASGLELVEDEGLLEEVSGLVEWPVVLMGAFEEAFLDIPAEVVRLTIRANQKCFVTRSSTSTSPLWGGRAVGAGGGDDIGASTPAPDLRSDPPHKGEGDGQSRLSPRFLLTANVEAKDGGEEIARGNGKVVRARLSDALYFWKTDQADLPDLGQLQASAEKFGLDLSKPLDQRMARLDHLGVTFHAKLGTQGERVERIRRLAEGIAPLLDRPSSPAGPSPRSDGEKEDGRNAGDPLSPSLRGEGKGAPVAQLAARAAVLAKADLTTEIVGEFPELQGAMGRKYALLQGEHPSIAAAIEEHYKPQGPTDTVPTDPVSIAVALADKLDTLVGFWAIDEKPTGSKDPYALRRAALGVIRILVENGVSLGLSSAIGMSWRWHFSRYLGVFEPESIWVFQYPNDNSTLLLPVVDGRFYLVPLNEFSSSGDKLLLNSVPPLQELQLDRDAYFCRMSEEEIDGALTGQVSLRSFDPADVFASRIPHVIVGEANLLSFFHDRLKVYLRDRGMRHDLIDAVLAGGGSAYLPLEGGGRGEAVGGGEPGRTDHPTPDRRSDPPPQGEGKGAAANDDLLMIVRRVEALSSLLDTEDGKNLVAGAKRAANILAAEEKKKTAVADAVDPSLFTEEGERNLFNAVNQAESKAAQAIQNEDFSAAMRALSALREPIDSFFEKVLVNDEDEKVRANRLALLQRIRAATGQVADFSKIAG